MADFANQLIDRIEGDAALLGNHAELLNAAMMLISLCLVNIHDRGYREWLIGEIADHIVALPQRLGIETDYPSVALH